MSPQEETLSISASVACPACGTSNTSDSKFCRHCGQLLRATEIRAKPPIEVPLEDGDGDEARTSPAEIDARRARQLLDRALQLGERGQLNPAILACRQASTLAPDNPASFAMLGTLLERNGDVRGAVSAYERVLLLSPDNDLERESLRRLQSRLERAPAFHFDPEDLFGEENDLVLPTIAEPTSPEAEVVAIGATVPLVAEAVVAEPDALSQGAAIDARIPPTSASLTSAPLQEATIAPVEDSSVPAIAAYAPTIVPARSTDPVQSEDPFALPVIVPAATPGAGMPAVSGLAQALRPETLASVEFPAVERRQVNVPVSVERRVAVAPVATSFTFPRQTSPAPSAMPAVPRTPATPGALPLDFQFPSTAAPRLPLWAHLLRGPSFFARTLPLVAVGVLSLGFLSWARSQAVSRAVDGTAGSPTLIQTPGQDTVQVVPGTQTTNGTPATGTTNSNGGFVISNAPPSATPVPGTSPNPATPASAPGTRPAPRVGGAVTPGTGTANRPALATPPRSGPQFPRVAPAPVPVPGVAPAPVPDSSGGNIILPQPRVDVPQPAEPPIQVGSSLSPSGAPRQDTIRITQGTIVRSTPPRTGSTARGEERAAGAAARAGQSDRAINNLTNAIGSTGGDMGYLYQQRAMAFMQRGDSNRAAADFQSSINAYQEQINRGENVAAAQAGMRAARAGLASVQGG